MRQACRPRQVLSPVLVAALTLALAGCGSSGRGANKRASTSTQVSGATTATTLPRADDEGAVGPSAQSAVAPTVPAVAASTSSSTCRTTDPLGNVYHPFRLRVVNGCVSVSGTVTVVRAEEDGDVPFGLALDGPYAGLVN